MKKIPFSFPASPGFDAAAAVAAAIQRAGFAAYLVGGAVRDAVAGYPALDHDLATSARPEELQQLFPELKTVGAAFGVSLLEYGGVALEIATFREERNYLDGRHPELVRYTPDPAVDVRRRDFTVNALLYDPVAGEIVDCVDGVDDIRRGVIRTVGEPEERFGEDYLRMLRAIRFAARLGFDIDPATFRAIGKLAPLTAGLAVERVREELTGMLLGPAPARAFRMLHDSGLLGVLLPEVAVLDSVEQPVEFHPEGNVFRHTLAMLEHLVAPSAELAWSVLLHDVGKAPAQSVDETGRIRFFGHEVVGAEIAEPILRRLRFANESTEVIITAVRRHMHFAQVGNMKQSTLRKLLASPAFELELELNRLDCLSSHGQLDAFVRLLDEVIAREGEVELPPPLLRGRDLVEAGFKPSPRFGAVLDALYERQLNGEITTAAEALAVAKRELAIR